MPKSKSIKVVDKDSEIVNLLQYLVTLKLNERGLPQTEIAKRLHVKTEAVNQMLKGLGRIKHDR